MKQHMLVHQEIREETFKCDQCGKGFVNKTRLKKHVTYVHGEKEYETAACSLCGKLVSKFYLNTHIQVVHEGRQWKKSAMSLCPFCGKAYARKPDLKIHIHDKHTLENFNREELKRYDKEARDKVVQLVRKYGVFPVAEKLMLPMSTLDRWKNLTICSICGQDVDGIKLKRHMERHGEEQKILENPLPNVPTGNKLKEAESLLQCDYCDFRNSYRTFLYSDFLWNYSSKLIEIFS